jgi:hypothetical protein
MRNQHSRGRLKPNSAELNDRAVSHQKMPPLQRLIHSSRNKEADQLHALTVANGKTAERVPPSTIQFTFKVIANEDCDVTC